VKPAPLVGARVPEVLIQIATIVAPLNVGVIAVPVATPPEETAFKPEFASTIDPEYSIRQQPRKAVVVLSVNVTVLAEPEDLDPTRAQMNEI
jgi:hypothetical protein